MHHLSSKWTVFIFGIFLLSMIAEIVWLAYATWIGSFITLGILGLTLFFFRKIRVVRYDDESLYVSGFFNREVISLAEVHSVNTPDSWGDRVFEIELKSGRIIDFIPTFKPTMVMWQAIETPNNVRRFQTVLRNFELKQPR